METSVSSREEGEYHRQQSLNFLMSGRANEIHMIDVVPLLTVSTVIYDEGEVG